jgi:hypothetical protein
MKRVAFLDREEAIYCETPEGQYGHRWERSSFFGE